MNQEPKSTVDQLFDECLALSKIATPGSLPYLYKRVNGTYQAQCSFYTKDCLTAVEALTFLKDKLYEKAISQKTEMQNKISNLQGAMDELNLITARINNINN
jgi:hypothetical protein